MKTIISKIAAAVAIVVALRKRTCLLIIRFTNLKTYATLESIIISITN